jgi:hypothetical protein
MALLQIVDQHLWGRVHAFLTDPERIRRKPEGALLSVSVAHPSGMRGSPMVAITMTNRGKPYRYDRCRHAYDKNTGPRMLCTLV